MSGKRARANRKKEYTGMYENLENFKDPTPKPGLANDLLVAQLKVCFRIAGHCIIEASNKLDAMGHKQASRDLITLWNDFGHTVHPMVCLGDLCRDPLH